MTSRDNTYECCSEHLHLQLQSSLGLYGLSGHPSRVLQGTESTLWVRLFRTTHVPKNNLLVTCKYQGKWICNGMNKYNYYLSCDALSFKIKFNNTGFFLNFNDVVRGTVVQTKQPTSRQKGRDVIESKCIAHYHLYNFYKVLVLLVSRKSCLFN